MNEFPSLAELTRYTRSLFEDLSFDYARQWKAKDDSRRVIGYLPVYIPREIIHAAGMLPQALYGAGDRIPVVKGDAFFQSYICHLPRTVIELALSGRWDHFDGYLFPAICDVIRNLSGIFQLHFPQKLVRYMDFPQNFDPEVGGHFYRQLLEQLQKDLKSLNGKAPTTGELNNSIQLYNTLARRMQSLMKRRSAEPHILSAVDFYLIQRAVGILDVEDSIQLLDQTLRLLDNSHQEPEDKIRVVVTGAFCEQPPLGLIKTIENAGCYIVEDDFQLGGKFINHPIPDSTSDPIQALVNAYLQDSHFSSGVFEAHRPKGELLAQQVQKHKADGVIFCAPSFCDPALLDRPQLEQAMDRYHIRHFSIQYHENLGQFHVIKEQAGTFADTIKLWE